MSAIAAAANPLKRDRESLRPARSFISGALRWLGGLVGVAVVVALAFVTAVWFKLPDAEELRQALAAEQQCVRFVDRHGEYLDTSCPAGTEIGEFTSLDSLPAHFLDDLQFYEDQRFMWHYGVSPAGLVRGVLGHGGGSTLTMQVARLLMAYKDRTLYRKAVEIVLATKLEQHLTKGEILELYVNRSRFGEGPRVGIAAATRRYFSKSPRELTRPEGILLISFLSRPARASNARVEEREQVYVSRVRRLAESTRMADTTYARFKEIPKFDRARGAAEYDGLFLVQAEREFDQIASYLPALRHSGAVVETTLDQAGNKAVAGALNGSLDCCAGARASAIVLDPNGAVVAYTVERPSHRGDQDLIASNATMPASQAKVIVYALFIDSLLKEHLTPQQILAYSLPSSFKLGPRRTIRDPEPSAMTLRNAVVQSRNAPVYWIANEFFRPARVAAFAGTLGLSLPPIRSIGIGQVGVSQLGLAAAYNAVLLRDGHYRRPTFIRRITSANGDTVLYDDERDRTGQALVSAAASQMIKQLLREVVYRERGTAHRIVSESPDLSEYDVAAKTGTSSGSAWGFRGVTGVIGEATTFSVLIQGRRLPAASMVAGPAAAAVVRALAHGIHHAGVP